jgi:hypothetical protein
MSPHTDSHSPSSALTFRDIIDRVTENEVDHDSLHILNHNQLVCESLGVSKEHRVNNGQVDPCPVGVSVKRGFQVNEEDHVALSDQILTFSSEGQNYIISISDFLESRDHIDPTA